MDSRSPRQGKQERNSPDSRSKKIRKTYTKIVNQPYIGRKRGNYHTKAIATFSLNKTLPIYIAMPCVLRGCTADTFEDDLFCKRHGKQKVPAVNKKSMELYQAAMRLIFAHKQSVKSFQR